MAEFEFKLAITGPKLTAVFLEQAMEATPANPDANKDTSPFLESHRGRTKLRELQLNLRNRLLKAGSEADFWKTAKIIMNGCDRTTAVSADDLMSVFRSRMNPITPTPKTFDAGSLKMNNALALTIPERSEDNTEKKYFSRKFSVDEVEAAKIHLKGRLSSARGLDLITYRDLIEADTEKLCNFLNKCLDELDAPSSWLNTVIIAIIKRGKDKTDPISYRAIGLESCALKMMTLLIHERLSAWSEEYNLLPPSQNGFRRGYRTNDKAFIPRCAIDRARAENKTLYVCFADVSNAFPSTEQATLWLKLREMGAGGPLFDWLRMLYRRMLYFVRHNSEISDLFAALIGILIGDTCSPILWNLYMANLRKFLISQGISLDDCNIAHLEQADDIVLIATSPEGLQTLMNALFKWCSLNFMILNAIKSIATIFGPIPAFLPIFKFGESPVVASVFSHFSFLPFWDFLVLFLWSTSRQVKKVNQNTRDHKSSSILRSY